MLSFTRIAELLSALPYFLFFRRQYFQFILEVLTPEKRALTLAQFYPLLWKNSRILEVLTPEKRTLTLAQFYLLLRKNSRILEVLTPEKLWILGDEVGY